MYKVGLFIKHKANNTIFFMSRHTYVDTWYKCLKKFGRIHMWEQCFIGSLWGSRSRRQQLRGCSLYFFLHLQEKYSIICYLFNYKSMKKPDSSISQVRKWCLLAKDLRVRVKLGCQCTWLLFPEQRLASSCPADLIRHFRWRCSDYRHTVALPYLQFCFLWFQLPTVNRGLEILLNGKFQK